MRTHRIKITCNSEEAAKFYEENNVHQYFVDFTHWYCGLDGAGEDTPDDCIIYRGIIEPNAIYVEFDARSLFGNKDIEFNAKIALSNFKEGKMNHYGFEVTDVEMKHLDHYDEILNLIKKNETLAMQSDFN